MDLIIHDSCDVVIRNKKTKQVIMTTEAQLNTISGTLEIDEKILGGIGVRSIAKVRGQKELTTTFRNALYNKETLAAQQGVKVKEETLAISKIKEGLVAEDGEIEFDVDDLDSNEVTIRNVDGETDTAEVKDGKIELPKGFAEDGAYVNVAYEAEVKGESLDILADKYSDAHEITYHTIGYDRDNQIRKDIYIVLYHAIPSGEFELELEMGEPIAPEVEFDLMVDPGSSLMAKIIEVDRDSDDQSDGSETEEDTP